MFGHPDDSQATPMHGRSVLERHRTARNRTEASVEGSRHFLTRVGKDGASTRYRLMSRSLAICAKAESSHQTVKLVQAVEVDYESS